MILATDDPLAVEVTGAIHRGDTQVLAALLRDHAGLSTARIGDDSCSRTLLHVLTDWPGHRPNGAATVGVLVDAGADVNARFVGRHTETPLHWAASCDDVDVLDALLDRGVDIEADGAVIGGGTPLLDATAFGQWHVARRLVERGAETRLWPAATLGLLDRVEAELVAPAANARGGHRSVLGSVSRRPARGLPNGCSPKVPRSTGSVGTT